MLVKFVFVLFLLHGLHSFVYIQAAKRRFNVEFDNITCRSFSNHVKRFECNFSKLTTNRFSFNGYLLSDHDLNNEVELRFKVDVRPRGGRNSFKFVDVKLNLCAALSQTMQNVLLKDLMGELRRTSNTPYECPLIANNLYEVNNYTVTAETFPPYTPSINFTYSVEFYENSLLYSSLVVAGAVNPRS